MPVHHRLRFLTFPMRTSRLCSLWPDMRPLRFRRVPFGRDGAFDPGGATASRIAMPHMLPSTVPSVSASAKFFLSWLNPPPHPITVYASHPPSPTTAQHSLPGGALPPYRGRSFTGRIASASPDAPEHSAVAEMIKNGETKIRKIVAATAEGNVLPPCGRCREMIYQVDESNSDTEVIIGNGDKQPLRELLPHNWQNYFDKSL